MRRSRSITRQMLRLAVVFSVAMPVSAFAFDWNAETGFFQWLFGRQGYFTPVSGHTLATACAFDEVAKKASGDPTLRGDLERAFGSRVPGGMDRIAHSVPYQLVVFGNWGNEIFTNSALEGRASHEDAGAFLRGRYHKWLSSDVARDVYLGAQTGNGYSSTYYLHSQLIDGKTQDESFEAVETHVKGALAASIANLRIADRRNQPLPEFTGAFKALSPETCNERCRGLAFLGSVFHVIEDSSVSCSGNAPGGLFNAGMSACLRGDGHTIVEWTPAGRPQVVTLSDDAFYHSRTDVHGNLDGLYKSCDTNVYRYDDGQGGRFDLNPKFVNARLLASVAGAIGTGETPEAAAERIWNEVVASRFASQAHRKPMPAPAEPTVTGFGHRVSEFGEWLGERAWQPVTNKAWYGLGRFVAWVDHRWGDADGWNEGVASAWGTTGGSNVARNARTTPGGSARSPSGGPNGGGANR